MLRVRLAGWTGLWSVSRCGYRKPEYVTMCGRFTQKYTWEELSRLYRLTQPARNIRPQYNICPTDPIEVIIPGDSGLLAVPPSQSPSRYGERE
jgi:hypothetical protein